MIVFTTILVSILSAIYFYFKTKRKVDLAEQFPGPPTHPIFGNMLNFTFADLLEAKQKIIESHQKFGDIFRITLIRDYQFMIADPKLYEKVLSSTTNYMEKNVLYSFLKPWLRDGLILSSNTYWHNHRKMITPAFHFKILEQFVEVFDRQCQIMIGKLNERADGSAVDIVGYITLMALDIITETAMGTQINAQTDVDSKYANAVERITRLLSVRFSSMWRRFDFLYATLGYKEKQQRDECIRIMHDFSNEIIAKRREYLLNQSTEKGDKTENDDSAIGGSKKMVFLDVLLQSTIDGKPLGNEEILEETDTFLFAGHDTTTIGASSVLYALSRNKHVQDKLIQEIIEVFGTDKTVPVSYRKLQDLKYMDMVIKETFRLYPPVPAIGRYIDQDIAVDDGRIIPAGVNITFNFSITFRDPRYFKDPLVFDPERFNPENQNEGKMNPFIFIPFSAGLRNCIGQKYALLDIKTIVSKMLRNFELLPVGEEPIISFEVVSRAINGMQMGLKPRVYS